MENKDINTNNNNDYNNNFTPMNNYVDNQENYALNQNLPIDNSITNQGEANNVNINYDTINQDYNVNQYSENNNNNIDYYNDSYDNAQTNLNKNINNYTDIVGKYNHIPDEVIDNDTNTTSFEDQLNNSENLVLYTQQPQSYNEMPNNNNYPQNNINGYNIDNNMLNNQQYNYNDNYYDYNNLPNNSLNNYNQDVGPNYDPYYNVNYQSADFNNTYSYPNMNYDNNDSNYYYNDNLNNNYYDNNFNNSYNNYADNNINPVNNFNYDNNNYNNYNNNYNYNSNNNNNNNNYNDYNNDYNSKDDNSIKTKHRTTIGPEEFDKKMKKNIRPFNILLFVIYAIIICVIGYFGYQYWLNKNNFYFSKNRMNLVENSSYEEKIYVKGTLKNNNDYEWKSENEAIVTVDSSGKITGKTEGTANIKVTDKKSKKSNTIIVKVIKVEVRDFSITEKEKVIYMGNAYTIVPLINGQSSLTMDLIWENSNESVATVNKDGVVTPKKAGKTIITISVPNTEFKSSITIIVADKK